MKILVMYLIIGMIVVLVFRELVYEDFIEAQEVAAEDDPAVRFLPEIVLAIILLLMMIFGAIIWPKILLNYVKAQKNKKEK